MQKTNKNLLNIVIKKFPYHKYLNTKQNVREDQQFLRKNVRIKVLFIIYVKFMLHDINKIFIFLILIKIIKIIKNKY